MKTKNSLMISDLNLMLPNNNNVSDDLLKKIISINDEILVKNARCKVCNRKINDDFRQYGSSCINSIYTNAEIFNSNEIHDKELFLHCAIVLKLGKTDVNKKDMEYVCESYLSKMYFQKLNNKNFKIIENEIEKCINSNEKPIMSLNAAYRLTNIVRRNKVLNSSEYALDNKVDETILKFFKHYFILKKITNIITYEVYYYMQILFWETVVIGGYFKNMELSSKCLSNSLSVIKKKPKDIHITSKDSKIISMIKKDDDFKKRIIEILRKYGKDNKVSFNENTVKNKYEIYYSFNAIDDLFYSLHSVKMEINGVKKGNKWNLKIVLKDRYDFTEILSNDILTKKGKKYLKLGNILNDMAAISSEYGVIKPYNITISFDWSDFD